MKLFTKIKIFFACLTLCVTSFVYCEGDNSDLSIDIPEDGITLSEQAPGNNAKVLYDDTFTDYNKPMVAGDQKIVRPPKEEKNFKSNSEAIAFGLKRGLANLTCCWLEIPKNLSYQFTERPLSAVATAPFIALALTGSRAIMGTIDLISCGFNGYNSYGSIPTYPWEGPWLSKETSHY